MIDVILKKGKERSLLRRHPWVYETAVHKVTGKPQSGKQYELFLPTAVSLLGRHILRLRL